jgi:hypothetical protein
MALKQRLRLEIKMLKLALQTSDTVTERIHGVFVPACAPAPSG